MELPHPEGWYEYDHPIAVFEGGEDGCATCHVSDEGEEERNDCDTCHHPDGDPEQGQGRRRLAMVEPVRRMKRPSWLPFDPEG